MSQSLSPNRNPLVHHPNQAPTHFSKPPHPSPECTTISTHHLSYPPLHIPLVYSSPRDTKLYIVIKNIRVLSMPIVLMPRLDPTSPLVLLIRDETLPPVWCDRVRQSHIGLAVVPTERE